MKENLLLEKIVNEFGTLLNVRNLALSNDVRILAFLLNDSDYKERFFDEISGAFVFNQAKFLSFLELRILGGSYTAYASKIGLADKSRRFLNNQTDVVLNFAYKDGVIKGAQTKDDDKTKEVFFNEVLAKSDIDVLFGPKILTNFELLSDDLSCLDNKANSGTQELRNSGTQELRNSGTQ
ncbi:site-specific DNA-methyltransferase, partial [Campylobacter majalis]|uniref:site-specific DNA-methyltransferase n=1 Tax=Campylobacter majalis TaxID=2790656 RepID=UPI003D693B21